jgi:PEP-CTERM motif
MKRLLVLAACFSAVAFADVCSVVPGNLVANCGFETGDLTGWTQSGNTGFTGVDGSPHSGNDALFSGAVGSDGFLSQTLTTSPGVTYTVTFFLQPDGGVPSDFSASWNSTTFYSLSNPPASGYFGVSFNEVGTGSDTLKFGFRDDPGFLFLDDVSVARAPEPSSALLLLTGLGVAGWRMRRRVVR